MQEELNFEIFTQSLERRRITSSFSSFSFSLNMITSNFYYCCSTIIIVAKRFSSTNGKVEWELHPLLEGKSRPFCFRVSLGRAPNSLSPKSREHCEKLLVYCAAFSCKTAAKRIVPLREYSNVIYS